ncbi:hypothetical protein [Burkholderia pseudomultivorans]|uniref:hypothetical protein n=1 Tax=Burkholderia pseudomultivorans TaxID=1207504 RepID=UPI001589CA31|nr:hypothetical protein [Burkholderia pseudomultivorans]
MRALNAARLGPAAIASRASDPVDTALLSTRIEYRYVPETFPPIPARIACAGSRQRLPRFTLRDMAHRLR